MRKEGEEDEEGEIGEGEKEVEEDVEEEEEDGEEDEETTKCNADANGKFHSNA